MGRNRNSLTSRVKIALHNLYHIIRIRNHITKRVRVGKNVACSTQTQAQTQTHSQYRTHIPFGITLG